MDLKKLRRLELTYLRHIWDEDVEYEIPLSRLQFHLRNTHLTHLVFVQFEPSSDGADEDWRPSYNLLVNLVTAASETLQLLHLDGTSDTMTEGDDFPALEADLSDAIVSCHQLCILSIRRVLCADTTFLSRLGQERKLEHLSIIQSHFHKWSHTKGQNSCQDDIKEHLQQYAQRVTVAWNTLKGQSCLQATKGNEEIYNVDWPR